MRNAWLLGAIRRNISQDHWNPRWSQVEDFGGNMAVELEIGELLYALVRAVKPETIIETGSHKGYSTLVIAQALAENNAGHLHTIDIEDFGAYEACRKFELSDRVTFVKARSEDAIKELVQKMPKIDLLWLDSDHSMPTVFGEIEAASPSLKPGSYIAFHDTLTYPSENEAVAAIRKDHPTWEYIRFMSARGFDLMRVA